MPRKRGRDIKKEIRERLGGQETESKSFSDTLLVFSFWWFCGLT